MPDPRRSEAPCGGSGAEDREQRIEAQQAQRPFDGTVGWNDNAQAGVSLLGLLAQEQERSHSFTVYKVDTGQIEDQGPASSIE